MTMLFPLVCVLGLLPFVAAQSSTSPASATSSSATTTSALGSRTTIGTTSIPTNGTVTLSANGTATATIVNGTAVNITATPTSTSSSAFPTLGGISSCVVGCLQNSVSQSNCSSITQEACFCSSHTFINATVNCVSTQCPAELTSAESLARQFCNMVSVTLTFPPPSASGTATVSSTTSPTQTPNGGVQTLERSAALATLFVAGLSLIFLSW